MRIEELEQFFGLPAQSPDFDRYLARHGVFERPVFVDSPVESIDQLDKGISLVFSERLGFEEVWGPPRAAGEMIFSSLQAYDANSDSGFLRYPHGLPYGLSFSTTLQEAFAIFGKTTSDHSSGRNHVYVWENWRGQCPAVAICFYPGDGGIYFFDLEMPRIVSTLR